MPTRTRKPAATASKPKPREEAALPPTAIAYDDFPTAEGLWAALETAGVSAWLDPHEGVIVLVSEGRHVMAPHEYVYEAGGWHVGSAAA